MKKSIINHNKLSISDQINPNPIFSSDFKDNDEKPKKNTLLMFERLLNNKNKFSLDNHFDKNNCQIFLSEKEKYLAEIKLDDGDYNSGETLEKTKSKVEIAIPNGAPTQYTFGQK